MNNPLRDTRQPREYWDNQYSVLGVYDSLDQLRATYKQRLTGDEAKDFNALYEYHRTAVVNNLRAINYRYSRGDELDEIRSNELTSSVENMLFVQQEEASGVNKKYAPHLLESTLYSPSGLHSVYVLLCWCVCMNVDKGTMHKLARSIAPEGEDRLVDIVLQRYDPDWVIAKESAQPKVFGLLDQVIDADEAQRIKLLVKYLNNWGKTMSKLKGQRSLGGTDQARRAKSNKDLDREDIMRPELMGYVGWWAWEVALVVRVFGIDDSSFADHVLYPVDMAHYRHVKSSDSIWPLESAESDSRGDTSTTPTTESNTENDDMIPELFIAVNLAAASTAPVSADTLYSYPDDPHELYYYAAVDENSGIVERDPVLMAKEVANLQYSVAVSSDSSEVALAKTEIQNMTGYLEGYYDRYLPIREDVDDGDVKALLDYLNVTFDGPVRVTPLPIASGPGWASWIDASEVLSNGNTVITVHYKKVKDDKVLQINGANGGRADLTIGEFMEYWESLVEKYSEIPL